MNDKLYDYGFSIVQIETKASCNMACQFCPYPLREDKKTEMSDNDVYSLVDQVKEFGLERFEYITFSQFNEPLMDNRILDFVKYAKDKSIPTYLVTNALLLTKPDIMEKLINTAPNIIKISLQTVNKDTFNEARGIKTDIDKYFHTIYLCIIKQLPI